MAKDIPVQREEVNKVREHAFRGAERVVDIPGGTLFKRYIDLDCGSGIVGVRETKGVGLGVSGDVVVAETGGDYPGEFLGAGGGVGAGDVGDGGVEVDSEGLVGGGGGGGGVGEVDVVGFGGGVADGGEDEEDGGVCGGHDAGVVALEGGGGVRGEVVGLGEEAGEGGEGEEEVDGLGEEGPEVGEEVGQHCVLGGLWGMPHSAVCSGSRRRGVQLTER